MKEFRMLVWLTQLGLSVVMPLAGFTLLSVWLRQRFDIGIWCIFFGVAVGLICAVDGLRSSLRIMENQDKANENKRPEHISFNDHE